MKRLCDWFDLYRDGTLEPDRQKRFGEHLKACDKCRTKSLLLDQLVRTLKKHELPAWEGRPDQIAARAFERSGSWDTLFLSWIRPTPAWTALVLLLMVLSFLWILPSVQQSSVANEYEVLMTDSDSSIPGGQSLTALTDDELESWLEQGGKTR